MDYQKLIENLNPEIYLRLKQALETGKWPDGSALSDEQKLICMDAILSWEVEHVSPEQRTGYIDRGHKAKDERCETQQVLQLDDKPPIKH